MKRLLLISVFLMHGAMYAQQAPPLLRAAVGCLAQKHFLSPNGSHGSRFGFLLDEKSYPGEQRLYIVEVPIPGPNETIPHSVYTLFLTGGSGQEHFNIQNNADFHLRGEFAFFLPPRESSSQQYLIEAIRKIEKDPMFAIAKETPTAGSCESYADPQPGMAAICIGYTGTSDRYHPTLSISSTRNGIGWCHINAYLPKFLSKEDHIAGPDLMQDLVAEIKRSRGELGAPYKVTVFASGEKQYFTYPAAKIESLLERLAAIAKEDPLARDFDGMIESEMGRRAPNPAASHK